MITSKHRTFFFFLSTIFFNSNSFTSTHGNTTFCHKIEKQALLTLKQSLNLNNSTLSSWNTTNSNCCTWNGVVCSVPTSHVHRLHLSSHSLHGKINLSTLLGLKHLTYLDLSHNQFQGAIPPSIAMLKNLEYLNLSNAGFQGEIPRSIGNLSSLRTLVLEGSGQRVHGLGWLSGLVRLKHLNMNFIDLRSETNWLAIINALPRLAELHLSGCNLLSPLSTLDHVNATSLTFLDLSRNGLASFSVAGWIFRQGNLRFLDMSRNYIEGHIPSTSNTTKLQHGDLSWNKLSSVIPDWIYSCQDLKFVYLGNNFLEGTISKRVANLTSLDTFSLSYNQISGEIPSEVTSLCAIRILDFSGNNLEGNISDLFANMSHCFLEGVVTWRMRENKLSGHLTDKFGEFKKLTFLDLTKNSISGVIPHSLGESSSLRRLWLGFNKLSGELPMSIGQLSNLESLTFGRNMLEGIVNETHFEKLTKLKYLFASGNNLSLKVSPDWIPPFPLLEELGIGSWNLGTGSEIPSWIHGLYKNLSVLDLSDTGLSGEVPTWVWGVSKLNLSHNHFHGEIPDFKPWENRLAFPYYRRMYLSSNRFSGSLPRVSNDMIELDLSNNSLSGSLSHFLCDATYDTYVLKILHLGNNLISGKIPNCWMKWSSLEYINLGNNLMFGRIPNSIGLLANLLSLNLDGNKFSGEIPLSIQNCAKLVKLDVGGNDLIGKIPTWIGTSLSNLMFLVLRSNRFSGEIPSSICHLHTLQILDISSNDLSGVIPSCVHNLTAMATSRSFEEYDGGGIQYSQVFDTFMESVSIDTKGSVLQYVTILVLVTSINLSDNNLSGEIPEGVTSLVELKFLNLSRNHLTGLIPRRVGDMKQLESLDLSRNSLVGEIPVSVTVLSFLSHFDLSYNLLEGKIPESTQILGMDASSFVGNRLCGPPFPRNCTNTREEEEEDEDEDGDEGEIDWFYVLVSSGYAVGFVGAGSVLVLNKSWRQGYFMWAERVWHKICVYSTIKWVRLKVALGG
ncbi:receptor-like protein EIX2 [Salvia hispanica]|uniref:receptor-like protein EIX2 n=1 Tax=Salvia hispanica TaxID=49212 RepID=UPI00200977FB|nr:receptor-like protein EIX2 [Salvia hispanica]